MRMPRWKQYNDYNIPDPKTGSIKSSPIKPDTEIQWRPDYELSQKGIPCVLTTDAMMGQILNEVNMVISGADRIYESGFVNKTGTMPLAITSKIFQIPFYVAAETDKILKEIDRSLRFYPQNPNEVYTGKNSNLTISNYYFEEIPFDYVTKIICEDGVFDTGEFSSWYLED